MNANLATKNTTDFTVTESGEAFISQIKLSELAGVDPKTIRNWTQGVNQVLPCKLNKNNQIHYESVVSVLAKSIAIGKSVAAKSLAVIASAGAKAYIYHEAGYKIKAEKQKPDFYIPQTYGDALQLCADQAKTIERKDELLIASNEASVKAGDVLVREFVKGNDVIDIGEKLFYQWMRDQKLIMQHREPYQKYKALGYFRWLPSSEQHGGKIRYTLFITARGKIWLATRYMRYLDRDL